MGERKGSPAAVTRSKKTRKNYSADFETTTDPADCRVWAWGVADIFEDDDVEFGNNIDSFMERISEENSNCYFHNLKFDGGFIIYWLLTHGYEYIDNSDTGIPGTFKALISDMGQFYSVAVFWENGKTTEFRDSLKKLPMPVRKIAKAFALEQGKGEIDYHEYRPVGHKLTVEEMEYLRRDVKIVAHAMRQVLNSGMIKLTVASDSLAEYKRLVGSKLFARTFPVLSYGMDAEIRRAYRGGFTYADPRFSGKVNGGGKVYDVNSLYPSVMRYQTLPYGVPKYHKAKIKHNDKMPLTIFSVTFTAKLKPDHIPCIQIKGSSIFQPTEYLIEITEPTTLMMTNVDWDLYNDHYDIKVLEWGGGWSFHAAKGLFDTYIDKWAKVKENSTGGLREIAKLHLNALYGKFASNPNMVSKIPVLKDGAVKLTRGVDEVRDPIYTAVGVFITSYARDITIRAAQANYDRFAYADTDSLHLLGDEPPKGIDVHPKRMGAWKHEYDFDSSYYIRPKAYLEHRADIAADAHDDMCDNGCAMRHDYVNRIAGLPERISGSLTISDLVNEFGNSHDALMLNGKLSPKAVPGGIVLQDVPFELKL